jgi:microcystin-dependent protein
MAEPFMGEIRLMSFNFAPREWALCNGQLLPIAQNQALFSLLGTMYGGDGRVNFALPDLRGRVAMHQGSGFSMGQRGGEEAHVLSQQELPAHTHQAQATTATGDTVTPSGNLLASSPSQLYGPVGSPTTLQPSTVGTVGGSQAHQNMAPFLILEYCIALVGIFPSRN